MCWATNIHLCLVFYPGLLTRHCSCANAGLLPTYRGLRNHAILNWLQVKFHTRLLDASVTTTTYTDRFPRKFLVTRKKRLISKNGLTTSLTPFAGSLFRWFVVFLWKEGKFSPLKLFRNAVLVRSVRGVEPVLHPSLGKDSPFGFQTSCSCGPRVKLQCLVSYLVALLPILRMHSLFPTN